MKKLIIFLVFLLFINISYAQEFSRQASSQEINLGDNIQITINIWQGNFEVFERIPNNVELIDNQDKLELRIQDGLEISYLKFTGNNLGTLTYTIKPLNLGEYSLPKTKVTNLNTGEIFDIKELLKLFMVWCHNHSFFC